MLSSLMQRISVLPGALAAALVVPLLAGCAALGLPATPADLTSQALAGDALPASPTVEPSPTRFSSNDGYALTLPPGWVGTRSNSATDRAVVDALIATDAVLGGQASVLLEATDADLSMVGVDAGSMLTEAVPTSIAILVLPSRRGDDLSARVAELVETLPTDGSPIGHSVISVRAGDADRYDLSVLGDRIEARLRVYLFTIGDDGILVLFGASVDAPPEAGAAMDAIVKSLRFGV